MAASLKSDLSFIGGIPIGDPHLSAPTCELCDAVLTFFFQVEWNQSVLHLFACTSCTLNRSRIPEMIEGQQLKGATVPVSFLRAYQRDWRVLVSSTSGVLAELEGVSNRVARQAAPGRSTANAELLRKRPKWHQGNEAPRNTDDGRKLGFVTQVSFGAGFPIAADAPPQIEFNWLTNADEASSDPWYELFNGNAVYIYAAEGDPVDVYVFTQVD